MCSFILSQVRLPDGWQTADRSRHTPGIRRFRIRWRIAALQLQLIQSAELRVSWYHLDHGHKYDLSSYEPCTSALHTVITGMFWVLKLKTSPEIELLKLLRRSQRKHICFSFQLNMNRITFTGSGVRHVPWPRNTPINAFAWGSAPDPLGAQSFPLLLRYYIIMLIDL